MISEYHMISIQYMSSIAMTKTLSGAKTINQSINRNTLYAIMYLHIQMLHMHAKVVMMDMLRYMSVSYEIMHAL